MVLLATYKQLIKHPTNTILFIRDFVSQPHTKIIDRKIWTNVVIMCMLYTIIDLFRIVPVQGHVVIISLAAEKESNEKRTTI